MPLLPVSSRLAPEPRNSDWIGLVRSSGLSAWEWTARFSLAMRGFLKLSWRQGIQYGGGRSIRLAQHDSVVRSLTLKNASESLSRRGRSRTHLRR